MKTEQAAVLGFAADHAGFELKTALIAHARARGYQVIDLGTNNEERVDYPDYAAALAHAVREGRVFLGIGVCGSGIGISIALNRYKGIRAALCHDETTARLSRQHNDANVLCLGGRLLTPEQGIACLDAFLTTDFEGGRHALRTAKLETLT